MQTRKEVARLMKKGHALAYVSGHHAAAYPGRWNGVNLLATGGIGGRDYLGQPLPLSSLPRT